MCTSCSMTFLVANSCTLLVPFIIIVVKAFLNYVGVGRIDEFSFSILIYCEPSPRIRCTSTTFLITNSCALLVPFTIIVVKAFINYIGVDRLHEFSFSILFYCEPSPRISCTFTVAYPFTLVGHQPP